MTAREELRQLADELEAAGRARAEISDGPCEDHDGVDCHAAAALTAWSRAARMVRERAVQLPDSETEQLRESLRIVEASADRRLNRISAALTELLRGGQDAADVRRAAIRILQGREDRNLVRREVGPWTEVQP